MEKDNTFSDDQFFDNEADDESSEVEDFSHLSLPELAASAGVDISDLKNQAIEQNRILRERLGEVKRKHEGKDRLDPPEQDDPAEGY